MTAAEAADFLRISPSTLRKLVKSGRLQRDTRGDFEVGPLLRVRSLEPAPVRWRHGPPSAAAIEDAISAERWEWAAAIFAGWGPLNAGYRGKDGADLRLLHRQIEHAHRLAGAYVSHDPWE